MRTMVLVLLMAGCSSTTRGTVDVVAYNNSNPTAVPIVGATVVFQDTDGSSTTTTTDVDGHASGEVESGGTVWLGADASNLHAYADIETPANLVFGRPPAQPHAPVATMTVTGSPPTPELVALYASCGSQTGVSTLQLDDRCTQSAVDVLAVGFMQSQPQDIYDVYAYLPARKIQDGGTIAIPDNAWRPLDEVTVDVADLEDATFEMDQLTPTIANDFGFSQPATADAGTLSVSVPLVGRNIHIFVPLQRGSELQQIYASVPTSAMQALDFFLLGSPWIDDHDGASFTLDDVGGQLVPTVSVTTYQWTQGSLELVGPPVDESATFEAPRLPDVWADLQPAGGVTAKLRDVRMAAAGFDAKVVAEESDLANLLSFVPDGFIGSLAVSGSP